MNILYTGPCMPEYVALMEGLKPQRAALTALPGGHADIWQALPSAEFLMTLAPVTAPMIAAAPGLRLIQVVGIGYESIDVAAATQAGVPVAITAGSNANTVAEHVMALVLSLYRRVPYADRTMKAGEWTQFEFYRAGNVELAGKTLGLVGLGNVGRSIVPKAKGFGMNLIYHDVRRLAPADEAALGLKYVGFADLLRQADVVSLQVPLTPETRGLIGEKELLLMKSSAILISTCRGGVVDEPRLLEALQHGRLAGAGLDVFSTEPLSADSPWRRLENAVLTPHVAGASQEAVQRTFRMAFENVVRVAAGQDPLNRVN